MGRRGRWCSACLLTGAAMVGATSCGGDDAADSGDVDPVDALLGRSIPPTEARRLDLEVEDRIADCMREEGFEYVPLEVTAELSPLEDSAQLYTDDPAAYGEQYGYGAVLFYELTESGGIEEVGGPADDPNSEYLASLTDDESAAYYTALEGEGEPGLGRETIVDMRPVEDQGCRGAAVAAVYGIGRAEGAIAERATELQRDLSAADTGLDDARQAWVTCMGDALDGLTLGTDPVGDPDDMRRAFDFALLEARGLDVVSGEAPAGEPVFLTYFGDNGELWNVMGTPEDIGTAELEAVRDRERTVWARDQECCDEADIDAAKDRVAQRIYDQLADEFPAIED